MKKVLTLALINNSGKVLLGMKKRGWGEGRWNGFGGKVEEGEDIESAAKREVLEECGLEVYDLEEVGIIDFEYLDTGKLMEVHIFKVNKYSGELKESEEMLPQWFDVHEIPFSEMWPDDLHWLPLLLKGKKFKGYFIFEDTNTIKDYEIKIL